MLSLCMCTVITIIITTIIIIIITFKGAIQDFLHLTMLRTVSNMYVQVAQPQSCADHLQHIKRPSHATGGVACQVVQRDSSAIEFELKLHLFELYFIG